VQSPIGFDWRGFPGSFRSRCHLRSARLFRHARRDDSTGVAGIIRCQRTLRRNVSVIIIVAELEVIHRIDHFRQRDRVPPFGEAGVSEVRRLKAPARP
jgi:hypothetical protein